MALVPELHEIGHVIGPAFVAGVHAIGGGVWIGAVAFNLFVLTPRARAWFQETGAHEDFVFNVVHGLRWPVLVGALAVIGTGVARTWPQWAGAPTLWRALILGKIACAVVSMGAFVWVTLRLWPRRVFATAAELPAIRKRFGQIGVAIVGSNLLAAALGVLADELTRR